MNIKTLVRLTASVAVLAAISPAMAQTAPKTPRYGTIGLDLTSQKSSVKPGDDFWTYVNGGWADRVQIAPDRASAGFGVMLTVEAEQNVRDILDDMAKNPTKDGAPGHQNGGCSS